MLPTPASAARRAKRGQRFFGGHVGYPHGPLLIDGVETWAFGQFRGVRRYAAETDWDTAMNHIVEHSKDLLERKGPLSHAFYTSGQMFLEEYYALGIIGKAGIGTPHMDGNTRLCTATSAAAMKESFGSDGQPGSYVDIDECDAMFLYGHNMAETQTVLWMRVLDRLAGQNPPRVVCVDPRETEVAKAAEVHLAVKPGTNLALMNGLVRELFVNGWIDEEYVDAHTLNGDQLRQTVEKWTPEEVAKTCGLDARDVRRAAEIFGTSERVLSTVLQGFYQSTHATASSCQVNNMHLLRGLLGKPGCGVVQMNGQPTQVEPDIIPHWAPPTHAMQIFRYAEQGSVELLWISATNPAVSMPNLSRIRHILQQESLFLVVQDMYLTETAKCADVVLPCAGWGEKTGTFTNVNRTVHLSNTAVAPPGEAKSDLDVFLDYSPRMGFKNKNGDPLLDWTGPEDAFEAWKACTRGRPCDYTGLSYDKLRGGSGIPWPCNEENPNGTVRLYEDGIFPTDPDYCETYGHNLLTGGTTGQIKYRATVEPGKAWLKSCEFTPPHEEPDDQYPFRYSTGRTVYQFHTRTKTARSKPLNKAAPDAWIEISHADAEALNISEGDIARVTSRRGELEVPVRVGDIRDGTVFAPFHYGYWDTGNGIGPEGAPRAANELTLTEWDPVSKQPVFKTAAVQIAKMRPGSGPSPAPTTTASRPARGVSVPSTVGGPGAQSTESFPSIEPPKAATVEERP